MGKSMFIPHPVPAGTIPESITKSRWHANSGGHDTKSDDIVNMFKVSRKNLCFHLLGLAKVAKPFMKNGKSEWTWIKVNEDNNYKGEEFAPHNALSNSFCLSPPELVQNLHGTCLKNPPKPCWDLQWTCVRTKAWARTHSEFHKSYVICRQYMKYNMIIYIQIYIYIYCIYIL